MPTRTDELTLTSGTVYINDTKFTGPVSDFVIDPDTADDYIRECITCSTANGIEFEFTCKFNKWVWCKVSGLWDWVYSNCPDRRVAYLMKHGKPKVRHKNFNRAVKLIGRLLEAT